MHGIYGDYSCGDNYHDIYLYNVKKHVTEFTFANAPRGFSQRERLFTSFTLSNPVDRICYLPERKANIIFHFAEVLWYLKGDNSLDFIAYYAPSMRKFSRDGKTLQGTAYGPKIFAWQGSLNQWECIRKELTNDANSKRAVIHIRNPEEMLIENNIDATCTLTFQFLNREGSLQMIASMRANDMFRGGLSDVFSFTFLQELMSKDLGLNVGAYHHQVGSSHIYQPDYEAAQVVMDTAKPRSEFTFTFPEMPDGDNWKSIWTVLKYEEQLRKNELAVSPEDLGEIELPVYWKQVVNLFELKRQIHYENRIDNDTYNFLLPLYKFLIANCHDDLREK